MQDIATIHLLRVRAHLVLEERLSLIDCGYAGSRARIVSAIEHEGRSVDELDRVICTHGHPDHAGSARELAEVGVPVLMHPADAARLRSGWRDALARPTRGGVFAAMTPDPPRTEPLLDGQILPVLGGLEVIHTPGHTAGSVCLYGRRDGVLFVGDTLGARFGRLTFASRLYSDDLATARRQVQRLASLDVTTLIFSHYPPLEEGASDALAALAARA
jgi:glyoxylase-like metal-dependent hydrolase (beta-lactamase superfamily II)